MIFLKCENIWYLFLCKGKLNLENAPKIFISLTFFNVLLYVFLDFFLPFRSINTHILRCTSEIDLNAGN